MVSFVAQRHVIPRFVQMARLVASVQLPNLNTVRMEHWLIIVPPADVQQAYSAMKALILVLRLNTVQVTYFMASVQLLNPNIVIMEH